MATLDGYVNAQIQPQVTGYLIKQDYREGSLVNKNDVLFEIDPRPSQAALDQAKAQLAQAEAQLGNATLNVKRDIPEAEANAIPRSQLESVAIPDSVVVRLCSRLPSPAASTIAQVFPQVVVSELFIQTCHLHAIFRGSADSIRTVLGRVLRSRSLTHIGRLSDHLRTDPTPLCS